MINRYYESNIYINDQDHYKNIFEIRNCKFIKQYEFPKFYRPPDDQYKNVSVTRHMWSIGDRFYKLADTYYGDARDWWLIAKFNSKPTESHVVLGEIILIPTKIEQVKALFKI